MKERDLTLVGLSEDRKRLLMVSAAGEEFTLPADARLRAALRGDDTRLGQLEITMESALRPRDIQARIRAGESPEHVASVAQTTLDKVMGYATPVLAERAHIADRAQKASVRRPAGESSPGLLVDAVGERLRARNIDPASVEWDAWRREDGRWTLIADYRSGESPRHAEFVFDMPGRYVVAEDDEARWLVGEQTSLTGPQPRATPGPRRLSSVEARRDEDELPLGEDALELVADEPPAMRVPVQEIAPVELDGTVDAVPPEDGPEADEAERADEAVTSTRAAEEPDVGSAAAEQPAAAPRPARKGRRAVPSWDEIMFGGKPE